MEPESRNYGKLLWAMALATVIGGGLTVLAEHSFSSPTAALAAGGGAPADLQATASGEPIFAEFVAPGQEPTVYRLPPGSNVQSLLAAVRREGVRSPRANRRLRSGERVVLHDDGTLSFGVMDGARLLALGLRIPLNKAGPEDLVVLPGIGDRLAMKIVNFRERNGGIGSYDDLLWIPGLGPGALEVLKRHTTL